MWENWRSSGGGKDEFAGTQFAARCYESHKPLKLGKGKLYGGCARHPVKADVYVVLQRGDMDGLGSDPWDKHPSVVEVQYAIRDMHAPEDVPRFKRLVTWIGNQLHAGKTVHVGCIGGHGRTGTVLSAVVAEMLGEENAIQYVRKHYCAKAVESREQVKFLKKHYGVTEVEPTKVFVPKPVENGNGQPSMFVSQAGATPRLVPKIQVAGIAQATKSFGPVMSSRSLFKPNVRS
jgi:hypothetical protein